MDFRLCNAQSDRIVMSGFDKPGIRFASLTPTCAIRVQFVPVVTSFCHTGIRFCILCDASWQ
jgi:hypothetical protein